MRWRRIVGWSCVVAGIAIGAGTWLAHRAPSWWSPPNAAPGAVSREDDRARALEQGIAAELTRVRPAGERWAMRVRTEDANAWLALRLPQWLVHDRELPWPKGVELVQIHARAPDRLTLAAKRNGYYWSIDLRMTLENGTLALEPAGGAIGQLWVPWVGSGGSGGSGASVGGGSSGAGASADGGAGADRGRGALGIAALVPELAAPVDAVLTLPDKRRLRLLDLECDSQEIRLRFESLPRVHDGASPAPH